MSEKLAVTTLGLSVLQVVAATVALYLGLTIYFVVEVDILSYASINYQLLPILIIGPATLAAANRSDFFRISLMLYFCTWFELLIPHNVQSVNLNMTNGTSVDKRHLSIDLSVVIAL